MCYDGNRMRRFGDRSLRSKQSQVSRFDDCCSFAFCEARSRRGALCCTYAVRTGSLRNINLLDTLGYQRNPDSKIRHRKAWIRSLSTVAIRNRPACFCFRMQPAGVEQGSLHAALPSHSASLCPVLRVRAPRQAPLCLSHRVAPRALRAWLPGSPCARALATQVLSAWPP
jgi:hypothetical protein